MNCPLLLNTQQMIAPPVSFGNCSIVATYYQQLVKSCNFSSVQKAQIRNCVSPFCLSRVCKVSRAAATPCTPEGAVR